jgi:hypothetical protein
LADHTDFIKASSAQGGFAREESIMTTTALTTPLTTTTTNTILKMFSLALVATVLIACNQVQAQTPATATTTLNDTLNDTEVAGLVWMLEEEKLAHDVYASLYDTWGVRTFANISDSEAQHMAAVQSVLERYGVTVPSLGGVGVFNDSTLQTLYDDLIAKGNISLEEALRVGAFIEEIDIADLDTRSAQTSNSDILTVYDNLNRGSRNHLRSFVAQLERANSLYEPQALTAAYYQSIISGDHERGTRN